MTDAGHYIVDELTPLTPAAVIEALYWGFVAVVGRHPSDRELCCHVAQWALETGHGKSCHRNNLGNLKAAASYTGLVTYFGCNEVLNGKVCWFHPTLERAWPGHNAWILAHPQSTANDNQCRWQAFMTLADGAAAQLKFFQRRPRSFAAAATGDPRKFARALKEDRYYTANELDYVVKGKTVPGYASTLASVFTRYLPACTKACSELSVRGEPATVDPVPVPPMDDPDIDQSRSEKLTQQHVIDVMKTLGDLVIDIPWGDCDRERREAVAQLNDTDYS